MEDLNKLIGKKSKRLAKRIDDFAEHDAIITKLLKGEELSPMQEEQFDRLRQALGIITHYKPSQAVRIISKAFEINIANAWRWIRKTKDFFGEVDQINAKTERALQKMRLEAMLYNPNLTIDQQLKIEKLLIDLTGSNKVEEANPRKRRVRVVYSMDPESLKAQAGIEIED